MDTPIWKCTEGPGPLVAAAVHAGHDVRDDVAPHLALSSAERLREEDPFTDAWTVVAPTRFVGLHSRFEVDLNRPPDQAVYLKPEDAWGLDVWKQGPPPAVVDRSMRAYHAFYDEVERVLKDTAARHGRFVVLDLHSYNHRRGGPDAPPDDPDLNPEVNIGTGSLDRERWAPVVDAFIEALRGVDFGGRRLDVRENVRFRGGHFPRWIHTRFPEHACALAIEFKKFFMDEWTGEPDPAQVEAVRRALAEAAPAAQEALARV